MRRKLKKTQRILVCIVLLVLFAVGTLISLCGYGIVNEIIGTLCQLMAFLFTILPFFRPNKDDFSDIPVDTFIDRKDVVYYVFDRLNCILENNTTDRVIEIFCGPETGIGQTELLRELKHLLLDKKAAKLFFGKEDFKKYKCIYKTLGSAHILQYEPNRISNTIKNIPRTLLKYDVFLIDSVPTSMPLEIDTRDVIILSSIACNELHAMGASVSIVRPFTKSDIHDYYRCVKGVDPTEELLDRIESYTHGNIAKVKSVIGTDSSIMEFEKRSLELYDIEKVLREGDYSKAREMLDAVQLSYSQPEDIPDFEYTKEFLNADLLHLENKYQESLDAFSTLLTKYNNMEISKQQELLKRIAHVNKHISEFETALSELARINDDYMRAERSISTEIMAYSFYEKEDYFLRLKADFEIINNGSRQPCEEESYLTYKAVLSVYENNISQAKEEIEEAINKYTSSRHRRLYNCFFIKGEVFRHNSEYKRACDFYQECITAYKYNHDFDLYAMASIMITYLNTNYKTQFYYDELLSLNDVKDLSIKLNIPYIRELAMKLDTLRKTNPDSVQAEQIRQYFDKYVFLIP